MSNIDRLAPYAHAFGRPAAEVAQDLESYANLLKKWQSVQNLVSRETLNQVWTRHFIDSVQAMTLLGPEDRHLMDLGSGGGFPALPLAIASKGMERHFVLVEPTARKVSFLRTVARELKLNVEVIGLRSDQIDSRETQIPDVITSRALAALPQLCAWMQPFFGPNTRAVLHKGREHVEELRETSVLWDYDVVIDKSDTDPSGVILTLRNLSAKSIR